MRKENEVKSSQKEFEIMQEVKRQLIFSFSNW